MIVTIKLLNELVEVQFLYHVELYNYLSYWLILNEPTVKVWVKEILR